MFRPLLSIVVLAAFIALVPMTGASAHVLKVDGSIGGVLHIEPDDNPVTGKTSSYVVSFTDDTSKLDLTHCTCMVRVLEQNKTIFTQPIVASDQTDTIGSYTFVRPDVYTLRFTGTPKTANQFQPFTLDFVVRVSGRDTTKQSFPIALGIGMALGIGLLVLAALSMQYSSTEKHKE